MDYDERNDIFKHCYNVLIENPDTILSKKTDWVAVSQSFFDANKDNMGMEIASKKDGKVSKVAAPAGYSNYVGNENTVNGYKETEEVSGSSTESMLSCQVCSEWRCFL